MILLQTTSKIRNNYVIFGNHQSFRANANIEMIVEALFLLSGGYLFAAWHLWFVFFSDQGSLCLWYIFTHVFQNGCVHELDRI